MTTPITKRLHMNAFKKASVAKQTRFSATEKVKNKEGNLLVGTATGSAGQILTEPALKAPKAKAGGTAGDPWKNKMYKLYEGGVDIPALVKEGHGTTEGLTKLFKGKTLGKNVKKSTPGNVKFDYKPELTKKKKGSTVDTSTYWSATDARLKADSLSYNQRKNTKKLQKYGGTFDPESRTWAVDPKASAKQKRRFNEYNQKFIIGQAELDRATSQALAGKDSQITARFEYGTKMEKAQKGGESVKAPGGTKTKEKFEDENRAKTTAGNVLSKSGENKSDTVNNAVSNSAQGFTEGLKQKAKIDPFENKNQDSPRAYDVKSMTKDFSTAPVFKKYGSASSMLKKSGMKMGGFGSKTYKK